MNKLTEAPYRKRRVWVLDKYGKDRPLDRGWELLSYVGSVDVEWRPNTPFHDTLTLEGYEQDRHSAVYTWEGSDGTRYPMFVSSLEYTMRHADIIHGEVTGYWIVVKMGSNYGLELYVEDTD